MGIFDVSPNINAGYDPSGQGQIDDLLSINPEWSRFMRTLRQSGSTKLNPGSIGFDQGAPIKPVTGLAPTDPANQDVLNAAGPRARVGDQKFRLTAALKGLGS
jgi:hypothetical protein